MEILKSSILLLSFSFFVFFSSATTAPENFFHCLLRHSPPSYPIAPTIFTPNNASYSSVLETYIRNLRFNTSTTPKPFLILTALHESHVKVAILCARIHNIQMKIRSGGHDYEGVSYVSNVIPFFILDMFNLRDITVDVKTETAWVYIYLIIHLYFRYYLSLPMRFKTKSSPHVVLLLLILLLIQEEITYWRVLNDFCYNFNISSFRSM